MKLSIAVADQHALPSAFVVWRGIGSSLAKAADYGFDGIELALKQPAEVKPARLRRQLAATGLEVSCISTGQVFAGLNLMFTDPHPTRRQRLRQLFRGFIDLEEHRRLIEWLGANRTRVWTAPMIEVAKYLRKFEEIKNLPG